MRHKIGTTMNYGKRRIASSKKGLDGMRTSITYTADPT